MLHFPSTNTAAHTAAPTDVARLHQLLGDHVWAFSNCRVDSPGTPVAEVDWLFYNSDKGTFILSEWKRYNGQVREVKDTGRPWVLVGGKEVPNPIEQVARQLDAVRRVLRQSVAPQHFATANQDSINVYQSVYCPQINEKTQHERLRYGVVHATLEELVRTVERRATTAPLLVGETERVHLAVALADVFRCSVSSAVRRKLAPPVSAPAQPMTHPTTRIAAIHRELAALHLELAALAEAGPLVPSLPAPAAPGPDATSASATPPANQLPVAPAPAKAPPVLQATNEKANAPTATAGKQAPPVHEHLRRHVEKHVPPAGAEPDHIRAAFLSALQDGQLRKSGVHVGQFGGFVGQRLDGNRNLASLALGSLVKWCLAQASAAGVAAVKDTTDPSIVRLSPLKT
ncbi:nuclease-related domain-containing protein [Arthrobacter sp. B1805]|uniref:nuclease-related domain-containing protein n=1 Tax=Arthrobacter sp. B1805 TaxID=2058892 RepID=UPI000CE38431|nr:nuclease-related domain-containing protein [Arthrobacter sp. B1805]